MIYLIAAILLNVLILILFKLYGKYNINVFNAIVVNYITATICGILVSNSNPNHLLNFYVEWIGYSLPLGILFITVFYAISLTAQKIGISIASLSNKMSVVIPVLVSVLFYKEKINVVNIIGLLLALWAVYLCLKKEKGTNHVSNFILLPILVFLGSGLIDTGINITSRFFSSHSDQSALFTLSIFLNAFFIGLLVIAVKFIKRTINKNVSAQNNLIKDVTAGVLLGIPNYFSIFYIYQSMEASILQSVLLFPVLNISNVTLSVLTGLIVFKEKLSRVNIIGVTLAIISLILISLL